MDRDNQHAIANARGWSETITQLVAALEVDWDRLDTLNEEAPESLTDDERAELKELLETATVDGQRFEDSGEVQERIQESPLSVQIRTGWYTPGEQAEPEEFEILLSTGGPALRIRGELDEHKQPHRAWLEWQDWGTPWTEFHGDGAPSQADLVTFSANFFFGE